MFIDCDVLFSNVNDYFDHLKDHHVVSVAFRYRCTIEECNQVFSKLYPFKKHLNKHAALDPSPNCAYRMINESDHDNRDHDDEILIEEEQVNATDDTTSVVSNEIPKKLEAIDKLALNFTLNMHMKNNFTRKNVYEIQGCASAMFEEVACHLEGLDLKFNDPETEFNLKYYLTKLKKMFSFISSDHLFINYLHTTRGFQFPIIITIENNNVNCKPVDVMNEFEIEPSYTYLMCLLNIR